MSDARFQYGTEYIPDFAAFREQVLAKTVIPHQVEFQPGPAGGRICWLECPYCYGGSARDTGERLSRDRAVEVLKEVLAGGVGKIIFAGYATDPLFSPDIEDLVEVAVKHGATVGFNTKALRISHRLMDLIGSPAIGPRSYVSVSVDAGSNAVYNAVHAVSSASAALYDRVRSNLRQLIWRPPRPVAALDEAGWGQNGRPFELAATYLVNRLNGDEAELRQFAADFREAGCDVLRFTFPQVPRGAAPGQLPMVPTVEECARYARRLRVLAAELSDERCRVLFVDPDVSHGFFQQARTTPCVARFVFPTVGYDGRLYHCSQSAAPDFRAMALGNLAERGFWECFYDYDVSDLRRYFDRCTAAMEASGCRCDRKEHLVNASAARSGAFAEAPLLRVA